MISALLLGSIGAIAETSDIQRRAYNQAMSEAGLTWQWDESTYRQLLTNSGGKSRLRLLADATATELDDSVIEQVHARKTEIACAEVVSSKVQLRPGIAELIALAQSHHIKVGLVTGTYRSNIDAIAEAAGARLPLDDFDIVVTVDDISAGKPDPECYDYALTKLGVAATDALAIEDTAVSATAARAAGVPTIVTPGRFTDGQLIVGAEGVVSSLLSRDGIHPVVQAAIGVNTG